MPTVKLGELQIDRRTWVRKSINLDHVRCLISDLVNGDKFPPLKVDRATKVIVGGNHRYMALKQFYGDGWADREVEVEFIDLPPFEEDPAAWYMAALEDNQHTVERLRYHDRNQAALGLLKALGNPDSPEMQRAARLLHFTPQSFREFSDIYFRSIIPSPDKKAATGAEQNTSGSKVAKVKRVQNDIWPSDAPRNDTATLRAHLIAKANALLNVLKNISPGAITPREREILGRVIEAINLLLSKAV